MMPSFSVLIISLTILSLSITHTSSISISIPSHTFQITGQSLFGDAHFSGDENSVQLNRAATDSSFGMVLTTTPFNFTYATSFHTNFTFEIGNGVSLVIIPSKLAKTTSFELLDVNRLLDIEFDVNLCRISSSRVRNVTKISNVVNDGVKLTAAIDYRAVLKRLDVRLSKVGDWKPVEPLISYRIDLGEILKGEVVLFGLASVNGNHDKVTTVYSWSVEMNEVPKWMHSMPVLPLDYVKTSKKKGCFISGVVFATGCGTLVALVLLFAWLYVADRQKVRGEAFVLPVDFKYEKIGVVEVKNSGSAMK